MHSWDDLPQRQKVKQRLAEDLQFVNKRVRKSWSEEMKLFDSEIPVGNGRGCKTKHQEPSLNS